MVLFDGTVENADEVSNSFHLGRSCFAAHVSDMCRTEIAYITVFYNEKPSWTRYREVASTVRLRSNFMGPKMRREG